MKKLWMLALAITILGGTPAFANEHGMDPGKKLDKIKKDLLLTPEQESTVKGILEDYQTRMKALKQEKRDRIDAILTPEQKQKHEDMMKEWKEKKENKDKEAE